MENIPVNKELELITVIVNYGLGSKVVKYAKMHGVSGGTVFLGKGTIRNHLLEFLELNDIRKEIALMIAEKSVAHDALENLNKEFAFSKQNHGIAFSISVSKLVGVRNYQSCSIIEEGRGEQNTMHKAIFVIVDKGKAEEAIEASIKAGSRGGTIINSRGSGIHETNKLFSMEIEPEKEIVLILSEDNLTEKIVQSIRQSLKIDEPGNGIMFIVDLNSVYGLY